MKILIQGLAVAATIILSILPGKCQYVLQFTGINTTSDGATQLYWSSTNSELYQIQYADALNTNSDGTTFWQVLYDKYPSHGTNTFIGDFGNYDGENIVPNPKFVATRFYRVLDLGPDNDTTDIPSVSITSPTNGSILTGQVTISVAAACSNLPIVTTTLYVDGQRMDVSDDGTNYLINTCEWANGNHTLFAIATAASTMPGPSGYFPVLISHGVSAYGSVVFSNLISSVAFTQPFFEPSLGQTQEITAGFAAECDWTLEIQDSDSNTVRTVTGSGASMTFDWDGTGDGGTNIPDGNYLYVVSASTNGMAEAVPVGGSGGGGGAPSPDSESFSRSIGDPSSLWVASSDGGLIPLGLYPPGFDTNGLDIVEESSGFSPSYSSAFTRSGFFGTSSSSGSAAASYSGAASQATTAPTRPPTAPMKNNVGTFGVAYQDWATPQTVALPKNGLFPSSNIHLDISDTNVVFTSIEYGPSFADNFIGTMKKGGWKLVYNRSDNTSPQLHANDLRRSDLGYGGGQLFSTANVGLFLDHGDYGLNPDYSAGSSGSKQTYFRMMADGGDNGWLRMCQIGFGGDLKWLGMLACNSLTTFSSMVNAGAIPLDTTHLICGTASISGVTPDIGAVWAKKMLGGIFTKRQSVANAWFAAGHEQLIEGDFVDPVIFRIVGYPECMSDTVNSNTAPTSPSLAPGNLTKVDQQVFP